MCCSSHTSDMYEIMISFASSFLIFSLWQSICLFFVWAQHTQMMVPPLRFMRSVGPGRCLIDFTGFVQRWQVTKKVVPFSPFLICLQVLQVYLLCYCKYSSQFSSDLIRSLAVALFDWWLTFQQWSHTQPNL
jgi:hypothetical protein